MKVKCIYSNPRIPLLTLLLHFQASWSFATSPQNNFDFVDCTKACFIQVTEEKCQEIFDRLKAVKGLSKDQKPQLSIRRSLSNPNLAMAMMDHRTGIIQVEKRLLHMVNEKLGALNESGLAFILAHELAHYLNRHEVVHPALKGISDTNSENMQMRSLVESHSTESDTNENLISSLEEASKRFKIRRNESQADLEAGFLCYLAGYKKLDAGELFIKEAYRFFPIDSAGGNYPSQSQRIKIIRSAALQLDTLINIYEAGTFLQMFEKYKLSKMCYLKVLEKFENAEILNNIGVLEVRENMGLLRIYFHRDSYKLDLPLTIYFPEVGGGNPFFYSEPTIEDWKDHVLYVIQSTEQANGYLRKAISINPDLGYAHLNLAINRYTQFEIFSGMRRFYPDWKDLTPDAKDYLYHARSEALKAKELFSLFGDIDKKGISDAMSVLAIVDLQLYGTNQAKSWIDSSLIFNPSNELAIRNRARLNSGTSDSQSEANRIRNLVSRCQEKELVNSKSLSELITSDLINWTSDHLIHKESSSRINEEIRMRCGDYGDFNIYQFSHSEYLELKHTDVIAVSKSNYEGVTSCGQVSIGSPWSKVEKYYGQSANSVNTHKGTFRFFDCKNAFERVELDYSPHCAVGFHVAPNGEVLNIILWEQVSTDD